MRDFAFVALSVVAASVLVGCAGSPEAAPTPGETYAVQHQVSGTRAEASLVKAHPSLASALADAELVVVASPRDHRVVTHDGVAFTIVTFEVSSARF